MAAPNQNSTQNKDAAALDATHVPSQSDTSETGPLGATVVGSPAAKTTAASPTAAPAKAQSGSTSKPADAAAADQKKVTQLGDFRLVKKLGQGGMGEVFLAQQVSLDRPVALKTLSKELAKKEDFVKRFLREARSMAKLQHPNVVQIYAADSFKGVHFVAIEFIDGQSMQKWMDDKKKLSIGDSLHVILVCAEALRGAHEQNMIHRDIKPDNILVTKKGVVKLADFGLAKALDEDVSMTQSGTGLGTPLYMPPEQARNAKHVDHRTDIYALGCTLYYFLTGSLPFKGENTLELIMNKEKGNYTPARKLNSEVPERLDLMISKMIMKDLQHRYASCADLMKDLSGLNLASPTLSFIEGASDSSLSRLAVPAGGSTTKTVPRKSAVPVSSAQDAAKTEAAATDTSKVWYVRHDNPQGKPVITKMTTAQVMQGIRGGLLGLTAKAKEGQAGTFLPLAQFKEFASSMNNIAVKEAAVKQSTGMKDQFAKLDKQHRRRNRWRWLGNLLSNVKGGVGLILWLALVAGAIGGAVFAWMKWGDMLLKQLNIGG